MTPEAPMRTPDEAARIEALQRFDILDTLPEQAFDDIVTLASEICQTPIGMVSLIDHGRQWLKARVGVDISETERSITFCTHAIMSPDELMQIEDATRDPRFVRNPFVAAEGGIRFYAGAPIVTPEGQALGTVCVVDTQPRSLTPTQQRALLALARQTSALLQLREANIDKEAQRAELARKVIDALSGEDAAHAGLRRSQRVEAIGQLASGIAHDFKNVLQTLSGSLQLIERKADKPDEVRRLVASGLGAVAHGADLTQQLLAFSRDQVPDAGPIDIARLLHRMAPLLRRVLGQDIDLQLNLRDLEVLTAGNATQFEAAIFNLAINARDAMNGAGRIEISTALQQVANHASLQDGAYLCLRLSDNGPGMSYEIAQRVFEPFFTTKPSGKGTGLGLAQVAAYAQRAEGLARIETAPGEGASVVLMLRAVLPVDGAPGTVPASGSRAHKAARPATLVDVVARIDRLLAIETVGA